MNRTGASGPDTIAFETRGPGGAPVPRSELRLSPDFLERWTLGPKLGAGAMGMVFRATERATGQVVAIKFLTRIDDPVTLKRFVAEGKAMSALNTPHVMRVHAFEVEDGHPCLVTEYLAGGTLRELMDRKGALGADETARILGEVLAGLAACHERGIVHRDVKPDNVMFDAKGRAVLGDLGVAKHYGDDQAATAAGMIIGTPLYMSPEQVRGEAVGIASDIYAAGVVAYEMVAGQPPFNGTLIEIFEAHENSAPPPLPAGVPVALKTAIAKALSKGASDRPQSAADFRRLLAPPKAPASKPAPKPTGPPVSASSELPWWSLPIAFVLAMGVGGLFSAVRPRSEPPPVKRKDDLLPLPAAPRVKSGPATMVVQNLGGYDAVRLERQLNESVSAAAARDLLLKALPNLPVDRTAPMLRRLWLESGDRGRSEVLFAALVTQDHEEAVGALALVAADRRQVIGFSREQAAERLRAFITSRKRSAEYRIDPRARAQELGPVLHLLARLPNAACDPAQGNAGLLAHALAWLGELPDGLLVGDGSIKEAWAIAQAAPRLPPLEHTWVFAFREQVDRAGFRVR